jgi:glycosyltransferase involved in cell wall biosynthesis
MILSVVIPCLNGAAYLRAQLEALAAQDWPGEWEIIVADNGSTDGSMEIVREFQSRLPGLRAVDASARRGQPYALNTGAGAARGDAVLFIDVDDQVGAGWLAAMARALETHDFVASRVDTKKFNPSWLHWMRPQDQGLQRYKHPPFLPYAGGGTIGLKRTIFEATGGFDESLPYVHDTDLCWKVQLLGTPLHFIPGAVIHMRMRHTLRGLFRQARAWGEYNAILQKRYRPPDAPGPSLRATLAPWKDLLWALLRVRGRAGLAHWVWNLGWRIGKMRAGLEDQPAPDHGDHLARIRGGSGQVP